MMGTDIEVRRISAGDTIGLRWEVLRPGFPRETAIFGGDEAPGTVHVGLFLRGELVGVASIYHVATPDEPGASGAMQLRGMAIRPGLQRGGYGRVLLSECVKAAAEEGCRLLWCNARTSAVEFYRKNGWTVTSVEFDIPTVGPHFRMRRDVAAS